jgi:hypothetical protein
VTEHADCSLTRSHRGSDWREEITMTTTDLTTAPRELDARTSDGIDVRLSWHPTTDAVTVSVVDKPREQAFEFVVDPAKARDAFHHPFAYAAFSGVRELALLDAGGDEHVAASSNPFWG